MVLVAHMGAWGAKLKKKDDKDSKILRGVEKLMKLPNASIKVFQYTFNNKSFYKIINEPKQEDPNKVIFTQNL